MRSYSDCGRINVGYSEHTVKIGSSFLSAFRAWFVKLLFSDFALRVTIVSPLQAIIAAINIIFQRPMTLCPITAFINKLDLPSYLAMNLTEINIKCDSSAPCGITSVVTLKFCNTGNCKSQFCFGSETKSASIFETAAR